ncbi:hypothetical protein ACWGA9_06295 [Streptomyces sp. NPDC054950]
MNYYTLTNGYRVATQEVADNGTEFTTSNAAGEVISTVVMFGEDAKELHRDLVIAERLAAL